jgi:hypothetical protein
MLKLSPIVLFVYNRPFHTQRVLDGLANNPESKQSILYVYCDGAKPNSSNEMLHNISKTRNVIQSEKRFKDIIIVMRSTNLGLATSIISGVSEVVKKHGKVIVMEDDILPMKGFLNYMNSALNLYEMNEEVGCVHAWNYYFPINTIKDSTFFLKGADCWGWGTWKRAWDLFESNGSLLLNEILSNNLEYEFDRKNIHPFTNMLRDQIEGKNNSWAIRWHASLFLNNKLCLHPTYAIVKNIGFDDSGEHCGIENFKQYPVSKIKLKKLDIFEENNCFFVDYKRYVSNDTNNKTVNLFFDKIVSWVKKKLQT